MRSRIFFSAWIVLAVLLLLFCSQALATRSRLSGMGDLSIVIEDESNMINLWDFAQNPAGLLGDENGSIIRGDFLYSAEKPRRFSLIDYPYPYGFFGVEKASILDNGISGVFRKKDDFALGFMAGYCQRTIEGRAYESEIKTSDFALSFSKRFFKGASLGIGLEYRGLEHTWDRKSAEDFSTKLGVAAELSDLIQLGGSFAYYEFNPTPDFYNATNLRSVELSFQNFLRLQNRLRMGIETVLAYTKMGFGWLDYGDGARGQRNEFTSTFLRLRGIYDLSSSLSAGLYYNDNDLFVSFFDPFYDFFGFPEYDLMVRHLGVGGVYKLKQKAHIAVEYHFRDTARERGMFQHRRRKRESINLGLEILPRKRVAIRGGYVREEIRELPIYDESRKGWRDILTFGLGYESARVKLLVDLSYRYTWGTIEIWEYHSRYAPGELERNILQISVKKLL